MAQHYKNDEPTFATKCLIVMASFLAVFTTVCLVIFCVKDAIPDTLVTAVFSVCGAETIGLLVKKILKKEGNTDGTGDECDTDGY